jgi:hypothetical protein
MKLPEPTNHRISNSLFDAINKVRTGEVQQLSEAENAGTAVDKAHYCATHVEHALLGQGVCISEQHAEPDENGNIEWYSVQFPSGIQRINTSNLKIVEGKSHTHGKKMAEEEEVEADTVEEALVGNQHKIDANKNNRIDAHDFKLLRSKKSVKKEVKEDVVDEASKGNAFDWKGKPSAITADLKSKFTKKKISTGTMYSRKTEKETNAANKKNAMKEGISQTIISHGDFTLEVVDNPTYGDYLNALQSMINTNEEAVQQEIISIAQEAYNEKIESIIIESRARASFKTKLNELRNSGAKVLDENYIVESGEPYVEYVVEQNGVRTQYVHSGTVKKV